MQMGIGQVPVMFAPDAPVVDTTANTIPDANLQTMFPEQFVPEPMAPDAADFFSDPRTWMWVAGGLVLWWAMRPGRR